MLKNLFFIFSFFISISSAQATSKGLPQLDFSTYPSLIFWSILSLLFLYLITTYVITPKISYVINDREQNLQNDLIKAKSIKEESDKILDEINNQLDKAKIDAKSLIDQSLVEADDESNNTLNEINAKINKKIEKTIQDIEKNKKNSINTLFKESFELSDLIISKTSGLKVNKSKLTNIIYKKTTLML